MKDPIMLDLETMDTGPMGLIVSIGAVAFDHVDGPIPGTGFHCRLEMDTQQAIGRTVSMHTVTWWMQQGGEAQTEVLGGDRLSISDALDYFDTYWESTGGSELWGNGSDFDNLLLKTLYHSAGRKEPWSHRANRCYRTLKSLRPEGIILPKNEGVAHNALDDAKYQATCASMILVSL